MGEEISVMQALRIKITSARLGTMWYIDKIGQEFWAENVGSDYPYKIIQEGIPHRGGALYVNVSDCEVIRTAEINITFIQTVTEC